MEATYAKLKDHFWYLSERFVVLALFSASRVADCEKKDLANAIPKHQIQTRPDRQRMPKTVHFGTKRFKHFVGHDS